MFKFEIIESPRKIFKNNLTQGLIERMKFFQGIERSLNTRLTPLFIIAESSNKKILGVAHLLKKKINEIQEDVGDLIAALTPRDDYLWECSTIYLEFSNTHPPETPEGALFSQSFYRSLYEELVKLGTKKEISFIVMKLKADVYFATKEIGLWPYVVEIKPSVSLDGLFHGILPLKGSQYECYQELWGNKLMM